MAKFAKQGNKFGILDNIPVSTTDNHTHTHTDTDADSDVYKVKETKNKRIQILTYSNLVRRMDNYAKRNGLSRAEVFEQAVSEFLDRN